MRFCIPVYPWISWCSWAPVGPPESSVFCTLPVLASLKAVHLLPLRDAPGQAPKILFLWHLPQAASAATAGAGAIARASVGAASAVLAVSSSPQLTSWDYYQWDIAWEAQLCDISWDAEAALAATSSGVMLLYLWFGERHQGDKWYISHPVFERAAIMGAHQYEILCQWRRNITNEFMGFPQCGIKLCSANWVIPFNTFQPTNCPTNKSNKNQIRRGN